MTKKSPRKKHAQPKRKPRTKRSRTAKPQALSKVFIVVVGALLCLFIWSLFSLKAVPERTLQQASQPKKSSTSQKPTVPEVDKSLPSQASNDTEYDFYELLKDFEVEVFDDDIYNSERESDRDYLYIIQVASFRTLEQAERTRAELLLLGLEPKISNSRNDSGTLWYRVRLGPFDTRNAIPQRRSTLLSNGFEAQIMKRKKT